MYNNIEKKYHFIFSFWILVPLLVEAVQVYTMGNGTLYTILLNVVGLLCSLYTIRKDIRVADFKPLFLIYLFYIGNYLLFPQNNKYFLETSVYILLFIYLPVGTLVVRKITDWIGFFDVFKWFSIIAVLCGVFITMPSHVDILADFFSYMDFSYFIIPFIGGCYIAFRRNRYCKWIFLFMTLLGIFEILIYGARGAVLFLLLFIVLFELFDERKKSLFKSIVFTLSLLIIWQFLPLVVEELSHIPELSNSRFLTKMMDSELLESQGRNIVYLNAENRLSSMGLEVAGLFGDRQYNDGFWPHNYFYEIWMQMGWIFGTIIIIATLSLFYKSIWKTKWSSIALFFIVIFFGRYIVSGSYAIEGGFWFMIFALIAIVNPYKNYAK